MINIALLGRLSSLERFSLLAKILQDLSRGVTATPVEYRDDEAHEIEKDSETNPWKYIHG